nr:hypothetical protein [Tanacetum cinerariifolium]
MEQVKEIGELIGITRRLAEEEKQEKVGDEEVVVGEGVVVTSSSLEMLTNNCLGGIMVSLIFLEGLEEEA